MPEALWVLFYRGGPLMWVILAASTLMWYLLFGRFDFLFRGLPEVVEEILAKWHCGRRSKTSAEVRREALLVLAESRLNHGLSVLEALVQILPLLGLLGTVLGMIKVFDVLSVFGTANARAMAAGISEALITTLAGLVTALSGLYFISHLKSRIRAAIDRLALRLST